MTLTNFNLGRAACTSCHGDSGEGTPLGPDLTGKKWLWSDGSYSGIKKTITEGVTHRPIAIDRLACSRRLFERARRDSGR